MSGDATEPPEPVKVVRADAHARAVRAWQARTVGMTWDEAASVAGFANAANAQRACRSVFGELPELDKDESRRLLRERLEFLWRQVSRDVNDRQPGAVTAAVRVLERFARLDGLDEPALLSISPSVGELERFVNDVLSIGATAHPREADIFADVKDADVVEDV